MQERREALETRVAEGEERLAAARDEQRELEGAREQVRRQVQEEGRRHGELKAQLSAQQAKVEQLVLRRRRLDEEVAEPAPRMVRREHLPLPTGHHPAHRNLPPTSPRRHLRAVREKEN